MFLRGDDAVLDSYKELDVWNLSVELTIEIYSLTKCFPSSERFGLIPQMQRSAVSIASNIAEGNGRQHSKEFRQFLFLSKASLFELAAQMEIAHKLGYFKDEDRARVDDMTTRIQKMLNGLIHSLKD